MKYLIIGLGNPGVEYTDTRHNIGFNVLNQFAESMGKAFIPSRYADVTEVKFKGRNLILIKPNTFMNRSGKAVHYWMQKSKVSIEKLLIITDDISLPFGMLRMRKKGSSGGHNGLSNINSILNNHNYSRLRFGIGNNFAKGKQVDYVLSNFTNEENLSLTERIDLSIQMIKGFATIGVDKTMSDFNGK